MLIVFIAGFLAERAKAIDRAGTVLTAVGLAAVPVLLVFLEPDFGTALVYLRGFAAVPLHRGHALAPPRCPRSRRGRSRLAVLWALPAAGVQVLRPYQVDRLMGFMNPDSDPSGATYNINQSDHGGRLGRARRARGRGGDARRT